MYIHTVCDMTIFESEIRKSKDFYFCWFVSVVILVHYFLYIVVSFVCFFLNVLGHWNKLFYSL